MYTLLVLLTAGLAAPPTPVLLNGDPTSLGPITSMRRMAINNNAEWRIEVTTHSTVPRSNQLLVEFDGSSSLHQGDPLAAPAGATIYAFDDIGFNNARVAANSFFIQGTSINGDNNAGVYLDDDLIIQESDLVTYPSASPGTVYTGFQHVQINDAGQLLLVATVIQNRYDQVLVRLDRGPSGLTQTALAAEGDRLPGQASMTTGFESAPHRVDFNNAGSVMFTAKLDSTANHDRAIYIDDTLIAREATTSPIGPRWFNLNNRAVSLNDLGEFAYTGQLGASATTDTVIMRNDQAVIRKGDSHPDTGARFIDFGEGNLPLGNNNNFAWFGEWNDPDTTRNSGVFVNGRLLIQQGDTIPGLGVAYRLEASNENGMVMSDDGRWLLMKVVVHNIFDVALLYDLADEVRLAEITPGIAGQANQLVVRHAVPGHRVAIVGGSQAGAMTVPCRGGTITLDIDRPTLVGIDSADVAGTASLTRDLPSGLAGSTVLTQAVDLTTCTPGQVTSFTL